MRRSLAALSALVFGLPLFVACSSNPTESSSDDTSAPQGPLSGTYSSDSMDGTAPFAAITFTDNAHYTYISTACSEPGDSADGDDADDMDMAEDDPADPTMDANQTPSASAADGDGCIHTGTYKLTQTDLYLTDDGETKSVDVALAALAADGTEVTDPDATEATTAGTGTTQSLTHTDALTTTNSSGDGLVDFINSLFGQTSVSSFQAAGRPMRRTGLARATKLTNSAPSSSSGDDDSSGGSLVTSSAVAAAMQWVNVKMPYCQAAQHGHELDKSCFRVHGSTCNRSGSAAQPQWNAYRSDCSGLVSWAWSLKAPGLTTRGFTPGAAKFIPAQDLQPGDALLRAGHHIVLFEKWINKSSGQAKVIAEPGCSAKGGPYAQEQTWSLGHAPGSSPGGSWNGTTYQAIRKNGSHLTNR